MNGSGSGAHPGWTILLVTCALLTGCSRSDDPKPPARDKPAAATQTQPVIPSSVPVVAGVVPGQPARLPQSGKVIEGRQGGPYTFVQIEAEGGARHWLATNPFKPKPGEVVHWDQATVRHDYRSTVLNQTFPMVLFVDRIRSGPPQSALPPGKGQAHAVQHSAGYTYIQVNGPTGSWLAVPTARVREGDALSWSQGTVMKHFTSKSLGRTFDEIRFLDKIKVESTSPPPKPPEEQAQKKQRQLQQAAPQQEPRQPPVRRTEPGKPVQKPTPERPAPQKPAPAKVSPDRQ